MGNICASTPRTADTTSVDRKIKKPAKKELKAEMRLAGEQSAKVTTSSKEGLKMTMETDEDVQASATVTAADLDEAEEKLEEAEE
mmetsp:Transcript_26903/g.33446  ORF Transcript_26903/g.33446 Transcript_26903/m.33446 type:complete len:85 (+) Transcript_26903:119-373(+)